MSYLAKVYDYLIRDNYSRDCVIFGVGGGITCDMTGFIASTFLRGVDFVLVRFLIYVPRQSFHKRGHISPLLWKLSDVTELSDHMLN